MAVGVIHGLRRLAERMEVTELGWQAGNTSATAQRMDSWPSAMSPQSAPARFGARSGAGRPGLLGSLTARCGPGGLPGEAIPQDPEHRMADVRLEPIKGQEDPALGLGDPPQAGGIGARAGEQFVVALEQMRDGPRGDGHPPVAQMLMDFGETTMLRVAQGTHPGNDIEAKRVLG